MAKARIIIIFETPDPDSYRGPGLLSTIVTFWSGLIISRGEPYEKT